MKMLIFKIVFLAVFFVLLYVVAYISNRHYRHSDDILFISKEQWKSILLMMLPTIIAAFMR